MDQWNKTSFRSSVEPILSFLPSLKREARAHNKLDRRKGGLSTDPVGPAMKAVNFVEAHLSFTKENNQEASLRERTKEKKRSAVILRSLIRCFFSFIGSCS
mmetsp:Transcript_897/g.2315  ORF Transcript_897/g.2315 Transcript_897/m.2315 type:complete len:101 (+) Transcript_897:328-630(+)